MRRPRDADPGGAKNYAAAIIHIPAEKSSPHGRTLDQTG